MSISSTRDHRLLRSWQNQWGFLERYSRRFVSMIHLPDVVSSNSLFQIDASNVGVCRDIWIVHWPWWLIVNRAHHIQPWNARSREWLDLLSWLWSDCSKQHADCQDLNRTIHSECTRRFSLTHAVCGFVLEWTVTRMMMMQKNDNATYQ